MSKFYIVNLNQEAKLAGRLMKERFGITQVRILCKMNRLRDFFMLTETFNDKKIIVHWLGKN